MDMIVQTTHLHLQQHRRTKPCYYLLGNTVAHHNRPSTTTPCNIARLMMPQSACFLMACLVVNPITVNNLAALLNCMLVSRGSDYAGPNIKLTIWLVGAGHMSVSQPIGVQLVVLFCFIDLNCVP